MELWRKTWRIDIEPQLTTAGLVALQKALETDDERLLQGATTSPPPLQCVRDWPTEAACVIGYCVWQGDAKVTVEETELAFATVCFQADQALGEPAACRWFLNWADGSPREEMRRCLLPEVKRSIALRRQGERGEVGRNAVKEYQR